MSDDDHNKNVKVNKNNKNIEDDDEYIDNSFKLSLTPKRKLFIIVILVFAVFSLWFLFRTDEKIDKKDSDISSNNVAKKDKVADIDLLESDRIINNVVDTVGAEKYADIDNLSKLDIVDNSVVTPPPLVIPSVPAPESMKPLDVGNLDVPVPFVESKPEPNPDILVPPIVVSEPSNKPLIPPGLDIGGNNDNGNNGRNSNMIIFGAGTGTGNNMGSGVAGSFPGGLDPNNPLSGAKGLVDSITAEQKISINDTIPPAQTGANQIMATAYGRRETMVAQGKVVDIVLETAINTDLQGTVRAIVSRDVYSEGGNNILIPRGSRVIGNYASSGDTARTRLDIAWTRVMRSDGIDLITDAKAIDNLGRNGASGEVDFKIIEAIRNALLVSSITISTAALAQKIAGDDKVATTQDQDGKVSILAQPVDSAIKDSSQQISKALTDAVKRGVSTKPIIKINQGTKLKIFVNQDIIFSRNIANLNKVN